ncbi:hypothetical protein OIV83_002340 [Microbotryomycetes sp. JL201]|nr:hypothetical protein OIV83_002340 [Microbotryomycetes sp. JL201]
MSAMQPTRQAQQDFCRYSLHFPTNVSEYSTDDKLQQTAARVLALAASLARNYIFHKQGFNLNLSSSTPADGARVQDWHLSGQTEVTDAIDDEWFIVWILKQISLHFKDAVVSIEDEDGEFLLIEAAEVLPRWITPQNAANRVWVYDGQLHLVPLEHKSDLPFQDSNAEFDIEEDGYIDKATAIAIVRNPQYQTAAPADIQRAIWARTDGYPKAARQHHHTTLAYLPRDVALALADDESLIAEAVGAFYERGPDTLKHCHKMLRFQPGPPAQALSQELPETVLLPTRLTKPLYSQLVLQRFFPPKPFERVTWTENVRDEDDERRRSVGMKITCGFEMLYQQSQPLVRHNYFDPTQQPAYQSYLQGLKQVGYFEDELEASQKWRQLELKAREAWRSSRLQELESRPPFAQRVDEAIERAKQRTPLLSHRITGQKMPSRTDLSKLEDSEEWLSLTEDGLENILRTKGTNGFDEDFSDDDDDDDDGDEDEKDERDDMQGVRDSKDRENRRGEKAADQRAQRMAKHLEQLAGKVEEFVQGKGSLEGAEFSDEHADDTDEDDDEDAQMPQMTAEERATRMEKLVAPLPSEEWGQKQDVKAREDATAAEIKASAPKLTENKYDGASDDESSEDEIDDADRGLRELEEEDEEEPSIVERTEEQQEMDMGEEMDEFLKFATETLGLSADQYQKILRERRDRGAFVPEPAKPKKVNVLPRKTDSAPTVKDQPRASTTRPSTLPRNPNLASFDALMEQMDAELAKVRMARSSNNATSKPARPTNFSKKGDNIVVEGGQIDDEEREDDDDETTAALEQMDVELASLLKSAKDSGMDLDDDDDGAGFGRGDDEDDQELSANDLNLVKNFLQSFQSQGGFAGPAGNLAGRMGFKLPRDEPDR